MDFSELTLLASSINNTSIDSRGEMTKENDFFTQPRGLMVVFDVTTSMLAVIANLFVLIALCRAKLPMAGYRRFLICLASADILMAGTVLVTFVHQFSNSQGHSSSIIQMCCERVLRSLTLVSVVASLFSIAGLSIDNFIGVFRQLHYANYMAGRKLTFVIIAMWTISIFLGFGDSILSLIHHFYSSSTQKKKETQLIIESAEMEEDPFHDLIMEVISRIDFLQPKPTCQIFNVAIEKYGVEYVIIALTIPCFFLISVIHGCIYLKVKRRQKFHQCQPSFHLGRPTTVIKESPRLVLTTMMLIGSFAVFWLPFMLFELSMSLKMWSENDNTIQFEHITNKAAAASSSGFANKERIVIVNSVLNSLLTASSLINPIIYGLRLPRLREELFSIVTCYRNSVPKTSIDSSLVLTSLTPQNSSAK